MQSQDKSTKISGRRSRPRVRKAFIGAGLIAATAFAPAALAVPPSFTGQPLTIPIPASGSVIVNLRAQGVITGTPWIDVDTGQGFLQVNGQFNSFLSVQPIGDPDGQGRVCVQVFNSGYVPAGGDVITGQWSADNAQNENSGSATVTIINGTAPTVDPQDPQALQQCYDQNQAPVANAGVDQNVFDSTGSGSAVVVLDGRGTTDVDDAELTYSWYDQGEFVIATGANPSVTLPVGTTVLDLLVTDSAGNSSTDQVSITVVATQPPAANAGPDRNVADTDLQPGEAVALDGSASTTPSGTITAYNWYLVVGGENGNEFLGSGATLTTRLPDGVNTVLLEVTSSTQRISSDTAQITVAEPAQRSVLSELSNLTPNQRRMANALDSLCGQVLDLETQPGTDLSEKPQPPAAGKARAMATVEEQADLVTKCRGLLFNNTAANQVEALDELSGEDFAAARTQTLLFANFQYAGVMDRLMALRGGVRGLSLAGLNIMVDGKMVPLASLQQMARDLIGGASGDADEPNADEPGGLLSDKWGLWVRGNYSSGEKELTAASPSFDADQFAVMGGLDYRLSEKTVIGGSLAYGNSSVDFNPAGQGALDTTSWALSAYGSLYAAKNFYFDAIFNVADSDYDAERNITYVDGEGLVNEDARGNTGGMTLSGGVSGGYDFLVGGVTLSPNLGVFYIDATIDSFAEGGAGGLNLIYDEQNFKSLTANLGLRATYAWNLPWGVLLPHVRVDYVREFENDVDVFGVRFAADPNANSAPPILVETENPDTSYWRLAGGLSAQFKFGFSGYVEYQRLQSFQFITFQDVSVGLRMQRSF